MSGYVIANVSGFTAGMKEAGAGAGEFGERFKHVAEGVAEAAAIMGVGLSAEGMAEYLKSTFESIEATDRLSISLGTSAQSLERLQYAAKVTGVDAESLNSGITKMLKNIDDARSGNEKAAESLDKLGLSAKEFVGLSADEAFKKIADHINGATDRASALHAAIEIFGKQAGAQLIPLLAEGSEGLNKLGNEADKAGFALNGIDHAKVAEAGEAFRKVEATIQGVANELIVALAPYLTAIADELLSLAGDANTVADSFEKITGVGQDAADQLGETGDDGSTAIDKITGSTQGANAQLVSMGATGAAAIGNVGTASDQAGDKLDGVGKKGNGVARLVVDGVEGIVKGIAYASDYLELFEAGWDTLKAGALYAIAGIQWGLEQTLEGVEKVMDYFHIAHDGLTQYVDDLKKSHEDMMDSAGKAWDEGQKHVDNFMNGANSSAVAKFFDNIKKKAEESAQAIADHHKKLEELGKIVAGEPGESKEDKKAADDLAREVQKLYDDTRTPLEKFQDKIDEINKLFGEGAIDVDLYQRSIQKAEDDLDKATAKKEKFHKLDVDAPKALEAGSAAAADFVAKFQAQSREKDKQEEIADEAKKQRELQEKMLAQMEDASFLRVVDWNSGMALAG